MKASLTVAAAALVAVAAAQDDSCRYHNDGSCDEPRYCHTGTDCTDCHSCGGGTGPRLQFETPAALPPA